VACRHQNLIALLHLERHVPQLVKKYGTSPHIVVGHVNGIGYLHPRVSGVAITMNDTDREGELSHTPR